MTPSACAGPRPRPGIAGTRRPGRATGARRTVAPEYRGTRPHGSPSVPFGTEISNPSTMRFTRSVVAGGFAPLGLLPAVPVPGLAPPGAGGVVMVIRRSAPANTVEATGSNGQPPALKCWMYSSRKYWIDDVTGLVAPSPRAQNARPRMLSDTSSSVSMSCSSPSPRSSRSRICTYQNTPSRHGVHLPHDSCA